MKTSYRLFALSFALVLSLAGCGTIMQGTTQQVSINSNPSNAKVTINGQVKGNTPVLVDLKRKDAQMIKIELEGYEPYETALTRKTSGWVWGNLVFGGLVGLAVDAISGGMYKLTPEQVTAEMRARSISAGHADEGLYIAVVLHPDPSWEKVGQLQSVDRN